MFLAVPLLSAMHAWLSALAHSSAQSEAREDARFLANILEGRWLMDELVAYGAGDDPMLTGVEEETSLSNTRPPQPREDDPPPSITGLRRPLKDDDPPPSIAGLRRPLKDEPPPSLPKFGPPAGVVSPGDTGAHHGDESSAVGNVDSFVVAAPWFERL